LCGCFGRRSPDDLGVLALAVVGNWTRWDDVSPAVRARARALRPAPGAPPAWTSVQVRTRPPRHTRHRAYVVTRCARGTGTSAGDAPAVASGLVRPGRAPGSACVGGCVRRRPVDNACALLAAIRCAGAGSRADRSGRRARATAPPRPRSVSRDRAHAGRASADRPDLRGGYYSGGGPVGGWDAYATALVAGHLGGTGRDAGAAAFPSRRAWRGMYVCMYVCMYVYSCVCVCVCMCVCV
jgi:hypothetical protein